MSIVKFQIPAEGSTISDLVFVAKSEATSNTQGCCTDGTHVFSIHASNIEKFLCSDMSLVTFIHTFNGSDNFSGPIGITTFGPYLYITDSVGGNGRVVILQKSDLAYVDEFDTGAYMAQGIDNAGLKLYIARTPLLG